MNQNITALAAIAQKPSRQIIGLMSGTSVDGLDVALCRFSGHGATTEMALLQFQTVPYPAAFKENIASVFSKKNVDLERLCLLNSWIAEQHAAYVLNCLQEWETAPSEIDLLASHGQRYTMHRVPYMVWLSSEMPPSR
jgi:anhydro-N-acetylmuramic acid kinase